MPRVPTVTMAYAMIRALKKRNAKGDPEKIEELQNLIERDKDTRALAALNQFFPPEVGPTSAGKK